MNKWQEFVARYKQLRGAAHQAPVYKPQVDPNNPHNLVKGLNKKEPPISGPNGRW